MIKSSASEIVSPNAEAGVIATLLNHPDYFYRNRGLQDAHFHDRDNRIIYTALKMIAESGSTKPADALAIKETLAATPETAKLAEQLNVRGLAEFIRESEVCSVSAPTPEIYDTYVHNVLSAAYRRSMAEALDSCFAICCNDPSVDVETLVRSKTDKVLDEYAFINDLSRPYSELVDEAWKEIEDRQGKGYAGFPFKFEHLNEFATIERGELFLFAAGAKQGKSMMLLNCAVDLLRQGKSVLYIDSELSDRLFTARLISHLTGIQYGDLKAGRYDESLNAVIRHNLDWIKAQNFQHTYLPIFDQNTVYDAAKRIQQEHGLDVLIVDYFKSTGNIDAFATSQELGSFIDTVKNRICGKMDIAGLGAVQTTESGRIAESAKIARNSSTIAYMCEKTPAEIENDGPACGNKKLRIIFNRNGPQHMAEEFIDLNFDGNHILFTEAEQHDPSNRAPY